MTKLIEQVKDSIGKCAAEKIFQQIWKREIPRIETLLTQSPHSLTLLPSRKSPLNYALPLRYGMDPAEPSRKVFLDAFKKYDILWEFLFDSPNEEPFRSRGFQHWFVNGENPRGSFADSDKINALVLPILLSTHQHLIGLLKSEENRVHSTLAREWAWSSLVHMKDNTLLLRFWLTKRRGPSYTFYEER